VKNTELDKLAKNTTKDISNRKINLSIEEKTTRIKEFFLIIRKFEDTRNVKCPTLLFEKILLPQYIRLKTTRLKAMFEWLFLNWKQYSRPFPEIPDFEDAKKATYDQKGRNTWDTEYPNRKYSDKELSEAFKELKKSLPRKLNFKSLL